jgi:hypothetical protein
MLAAAISADFHKHVRKAYAPSLALSFADRSLELLLRHVGGNFED